MYYTVAGGCKSTDGNCVHVRIYSHSLLGGVHYIHMYAVSVTCSMGVCMGVCMCVCMYTRLCGSVACLVEEAIHWRELLFRLCLQAVHTYMDITCSKNIILCV